MIQNPMFLASQILKRMRGMCTLDLAQESGRYIIVKLRALVQPSSDIGCLSDLGGGAGPFSGLQFLQKDRFR